MNTKEMYTAAICRGDLKQCPTGSNNSNNNKSITPHELTQTSTKSRKGYFFDESKFMYCMLYRDILPLMH